MEEERINVSERNILLHDELTKEGSARPSLRCSEGGG